MLKFISTIKSEKTNEELSVNYGFNEGIIDQLIYLGKSDPEIIKYTNDDVRFKDKETFYKWLEKGSYIYPLVDKLNNLFGVIWFRYRKIPEDSNSDIQETFPVFSIRIYENARGNGFALKFMNIVFKHFLNEIDNKSDKVWLGVYKSNNIAHNLYKKFGFQDLGEIPSWHEYLMIYKK